MTPLNIGHGVKNIDRVLFDLSVRILIPGIM